LIKPGNERREGGMNERMFDTAGKRSPIVGPFYSACSKMVWKNWQIADKVR